MKQLHNPQNLNLPPLVIQKIDLRRDMEKNSNISNFINSNLLLDKDFHKLFSDLFKKSREAEEIITSFADDTHFSYRSLRYADFKALNSKDRFLIKNYLFHSKRYSKEIPEKARAKIEMLEMDIRKENFKQAITSIKRKSNNIQSTLSKFEKIRKINLDILTSLTLFICNNCKYIISKDRFKQSKCICGRNINTISNTIKVPVAFFDQMLKDFIERNFWFEYGIDYLLRKKNFQTLCGYYVLGHSGNWHEIDNIAESKSSNFRFFCECKTGQIKTSDVFIFAGKMADVGCSRGYLFSI